MRCLVVGPLVGPLTLRRLGSRASSARVFLLRGRRRNRSRDLRRERLFRAALPLRFLPRRPLFLSRCSSSFINVGIAARYSSSGNSADGSGKSGGRVRDEVRPSPIDGKSVQRTLRDEVRPSPIDGKSVQHTLRDEVRPSPIDGKSVQRVSRGQ